MYLQWEESLIAAYLAGSAQTQRDYAEHFQAGRQHEPGN